MFPFTPKTETKIDAKPTNPFEKMKAEIDKAVAEAERAGVWAKAIRDYFEGSLELWRRRALYQADLANQSPRHLVAAAAVNDQKRREAERLASQRDWEESVNRRFEDEKWRRS